MTGTVTATVIDVETESETESEVARETARAAGLAPEAREAGVPAAEAGKPVAVPVSRATGGPRGRRRSDQRWEVTEADLNMYGLIVGRPPTEAEKVAALTPVPNEATTLRDAGAGRGGGPSVFATFPRWGGRARYQEGPTWSPSVMFAYLRDVYRFGTNLTAPQVTAWVRQMSSEARRRLQETQARLAAPRSR